MRVFLIRHGQSIMNGLGIHQHRGAELSKIRKEQVFKLTEQLYDAKIDLIISGKYPMVVDIAKTIGRKLDKPETNEEKEAIREGRNFERRMDEIHSTLLEGFGLPQSFSEDLSLLYFLQLKNTK